MGVGEQPLFFVGTYSDPEVENVFLYRADFARQELTRLASRSGLTNPSYLLQRKDGLLYAVEELASGGYVGAYQSNAAGMPRLGRVPSAGADPCHLEMDDRGEFLFVANYSSGSCAMFELGADAGALRLCHLREHQGTGINPERQEAPHVHFSHYVDGLLYVCDLGLDTVFCYRVDREGRRLEETSLDLKVSAGSGPRHLCFSPVNRDFLYVLAELTAEVFLFHRESGRYVLRQAIGSLPDGVPAGNRGAAIKFSEDGALLYVSNRGSDSLTAFGVGGDGRLVVLDVCRTGGRTPRDFACFGDHCVVANQDSSLLTVLRFDRSSDRFRRLDMNEPVIHPVCILEKQGA